MVLTPQLFNQSASRCRSAVKHLNWRTGPDLDPVAQPHNGKRYLCQSRRPAGESRPTPGHWTATVLPIPSSPCEYANACLLSFRLSLVGKWDPVRPGDDKVEEPLHRGQ